MKIRREPLLPMRCRINSRQFAKVVHDDHNVDDLPHTWDLTDPWWSRSERDIGDAPWLIEDLKTFFSDAVDPFRTTEELGLTNMAIETSVPKAASAQRASPGAI